MMSSEKSQIVLLGTGTPNPDPMRFGPSVAIIANGTSYIVDFGPGVVRRAVAAHEKFGIAAFSPPNLKTAFLTHLHSDHTTGYADLIFTPWVVGRVEPLEVYGPEGTRAMTDHILKAYQPDIDERLQGLEPANEMGYHVNVHEITPGIVYEDPNIMVEAFSVVHGELPSFGFKFTTADRTIVLSGDTAPTDVLVEKARGCDVLIHEVYSAVGFARRPLIWQKYHSRVHTSSVELAEIASKAQPGLLILYHQLFWGEEEKDLLQEVQQEYPGLVVSGADLEIY
ncbi:MAG: MBL fold metallo-hydrolase [Candidatus Hodarchaeales archaeon]|jgi:ribonuclease BN (tRNA processing enzyme)